MTIKRSLFIAATCTLILPAGALALSSCASSSPSVDPFEVADEDSREMDLLDEPSRANRTRSNAPRVDSDLPLYIVPEADAAPLRTIDAEAEGWDLSASRTFDERRHLHFGASQWSGSQDASFSVAIDSDDSHLYFWVEVTDDEVLTSSPHNPLDGVVIWLRDPALNELIKSLPETLQEELNISTDTALTITPDAQVTRHQSQLPLSPNSVHVATRPTSDGYIVEAALSLEVFPFIHSIPLDEIAFRVELFDSDDSTDQSPQKHLTMLPRSRDETPRFAVYDTQGLLPATAPQNPPPRFDALGFWQQQSEEWNFRLLEYLTPRWRVLEDLHLVASQVEDRTPLPFECTGPDQEIFVLEVYEYANRGRRVALAICGQMPENGGCSEGAESQLYWISMASEDRQSWSIDHVNAVFKEPLDQCPLVGVSNQPLYRDFSLLPLDVVGSTVWGVGWEMELDAHLQRRSESGVVFVDPRSPDFIVGEAPLRQRRAFERSLSIRSSRVFFTRLDDNESMDICELEEIRDHRCSSFETDCGTTERGQERLVHFKMWNSERHRFDASLLHQHPRCRHSTEFSNIDGFQLLLIGGRLGLLPSSLSDQ